MKKQSVCLLILMILSNVVFSQEKTNAKPLEKPVETHSPRKALFLSLIPGLGQVYNRKHWKVPIVYVALGLTSYFIVTNHNQYTDFLSALKTRNRGEVDKYNNVFSDNQLITSINYYQNNRDLSIIIGAVFYAANILDAYIDAHLFSFDVSDDLSMKISPILIEPPLNNTLALSSIGVQVGIKF